MGNDVTASAGAPGSSLGPSDGQNNAAQAGETHQSMDGAQLPDIDEGLPRLWAPDPESFDGRAERRRLDGGADDDALTARPGNEVLTTGPGQDLVIVSSDTTGRTVIGDFDIEDDVLRLDSVRVEGIEVQNGAAILTLTNGGEVAFQDLSVPELQQALGRTTIEADEASDADARLPIYVLAGQSNASYVTSVREEMLSEFRNLGEPFGLLDLAIPGSTLASVEARRPDWHPTSDGELFDRLIDRIARAKEDAEKMRYAPDVNGIFWIQGEADARRPETADAYGDNLRDLIEATTLAIDDEFEFIIAELRTTDQIYLHHERVRAAQQAVAAEDDRVVLVDTDGFDLADTVHYSNLGSAQLADALVATIENAHRAYFAAADSGLLPE